MKDNLPARPLHTTYLEIATQTQQNLRKIALIISFFALLAINIHAQVEPYDILITEIMVDPNPPVALPNFEWVELLNTSNEMINLQDFQFSSGATRSKLPSYDLSPGGFVLLCDDDDLVELSVLGAAIAIPTFPSLTNTGDVVRIENPDDLLLHEVIYDRSWYNNTDKDDGGFTLEMINPGDPCLAASNWSVSESPSGGTPGLVNSIWNQTTPSSGLIVEEAFITSPDQITIQFNRIPDAGLETTLFSLNPTITILDVFLDMGDPRKVIIDLNQELTPSVLYTLSIDATIQDCTGAASGETQMVNVVRGEPLELNDLIINEVLFNPIGASSDYVELYNRSAKYLSLSGTQIGNIDPSGSSVIKDIAPVNFLIEPQSFLVLTENKSALINRFPNAEAELIIEIDLPSFNNDAGNVSLINASNIDPVVVDAFDYTEDFHNPFIDDADGIALERVDPEIDTQVATNWQSASSKSNYGTPTMVNSQNQALPNGEVSVFLAQKTFFPEGHLTDEELRIIFELDRSDYIGSIDIYNGAGLFVHQLVNNQILGRNDQYTWDGRASSGQLQQAGVYILWIRLVTNDGKLVVKKLPCVLSRSL